MILPLVQPVVLPSWSKQNIQELIHLVGELPLLCDGQSRIAGFPRIVEYLCSQHNLALDVKIPRLRRAEATAWVLPIQS